MMIECREAVSRMWSYLARDLDGSDADELEQHLGVCLRCCGELEFSRELRSKVAVAGADRMPPAVRQRIESFIEDPQGSS